MRGRQRKCLFRKNIKKSAAGGKQSEERKEEMLRGYESDRGWKAKECQEGWGRRPVWRLLSFTVLHVHLQPLMGRSEIREKENRRFVCLQMRSVHYRGKRKWRTETGNNGLPPLLRLDRLLHQSYAGYRCSKAPKLCTFQTFYQKKEKHLGLRSNGMIFEAFPKLFSFMR